MIVFINLIIVGQSFQSNLLWYVPFIQTFQSIPDKNFQVIIIRQKYYILKNKKMIQTPQPIPLSPQLLSQIRQNQSTYWKVSQLAYYSSLQSIQQLAVFTKSSCDVECNVVFCYHGENFVADKAQQIKYYIIRTLNQQVPRLKNKFSIAYVHDSVSNFFYFRNVMKLLPASHLEKLKSFYIVHGRLVIKLIQKLSLGQINNYIKQRTVHLQNVEEIQIANKITLGGNIVSKSKMKLMQENKDKENHRQHLTLTKEMESSDANIIRNKMYGKQLSEYELSPQSEIPKIIEIQIIRLYSTTTFLQSEGIMRKSCDVEQLQVLENHIMDDPNWQNFIFQYDNPYVICGCVKKIFNNLNSPLFSYQIYDSIMSYRSDGQKGNDIKFLSACIGRMSKINRLVLFYTAAFLKKGIITYQQSNKMSAHNLAVVFGPCFFRPKQYQFQNLMYSGKFSSMIKLLLENYQDVIGQENAINMYNLLDKQKMHLKFA